EGQVAADGRSGQDEDAVVAVGDAPAPGRADEEAPAGDVGPALGQVAHDGAVLDGHGGRVVEEGAGPAEPGEAGAAAPAAGHGPVADEGAVGDEGGRADGAVDPAALGAAAPGAADRLVVDEPAVTHRQAAAQVEDASPARDLLRPPRSEVGA